MGESEIEEFLSHLVTSRNVSATTQNKPTQNVKHRLVLLKKQYSFIQTGQAS